MDFKKLWEYLKSLPTWARIVAILAAAVAAIALSSCSRSAVRFKGTGTIEYEYRGSNGPVIGRDDEA